MAALQIVIDTNVLVAAFRSQRGASHRLLSLVDEGMFEVNLSVPLVLEYEDVLNRPEFGFSPEEIRAVVDYLCKISRHHAIYFLWRPLLNDPKDEMVLELAMTARCDHIISFNQRDFRGSETLGIQITPPRDFLTIIGDIP